MPRSLARPNHILLAFSNLTHIDLPSFRNGLQGAQRVLPLVVARGVRRGLSCTVIACCVPHLRRNHLVERSAIIVDTVTHIVVQWRPNVCAQLHVG